MMIDDSKMKSNIPGMELVSGIVSNTSEKTQEFTVLCPDGSQRVIFVPRINKSLYLMKNIQLGVQVIIHQTKSGPKTITTYVAIEKQD